VDIAQAALTTLGDEEFFSVRIQVGNQLPGVEVADGGAHGHAQGDVIPAFAVAIGAPAAFPVLRQKFPGIAVVDQGVDIAIRNGVNAAAPAAVAAVRAAFGNVFFPPESGNTVAALASDDQNFGFVDEFHG